MVDHIWLGPPLLPLHSNTNTASHTKIGTEAKAEDSAYVFDHIWLSPQVLPLTSHSDTNTNTHIKTWTKTKAEDSMPGCLAGWPAWFYLAVCVISQIHFHRMCFDYICSLLASPLWLHIPIQIPILILRLCLRLKQKIPCLNAWCAQKPHGQVLTRIHQPFDLGICISMLLRNNCFALNTSLVQR